MIARSDRTVADRRVGNGDGVEMRDRIKRRTRAPLPFNQLTQDAFLGSTARDQMDRMAPPLLADAIDATDTLFHTQRRPRHLQVRYQPAAMMQIQSFAASIGCEQYAR